MKKNESVNENVTSEQVEEQGEEQLSLEVKRVKSLKTNVKGGWGTRGGEEMLSLQRPGAHQP